MRAHQQQSVIRYNDPHPTDTLRFREAADRITCVVVLVIQFFADSFTITVL